MDKKKITIFIIIVCLLTFFYWISRLHHKNNSLVLYGNVDIREVALGFRVSGQLQTLKVDEGDTVHAGELLGNLDPEPQKRSVEVAAAGINQKTASLEYAKTVYLREKKLSGTGASSTNNYQNAISQFEQAKAAQQKSVAEYDEAMIRLHDTNLISPSNGTVLTRVVEPGSVLPANATVLTVSLINPVWVRAYVSEINLSQAKPGTKVQITADSLHDQVLTGQIGFVSPTAEFTPKTVETPDLRTQLVYRLRIIVTDPNHVLRQGMPVTIKF
jgi:HlyD family secretion protein